MAQALERAVRAGWWARGSVNDKRRAILTVLIEVPEPNTHTWLSRTDRLHRTLRQRIGEHFEREDTHRWVDALPDITDNYNTSPHRTLSEVLRRKAAPADITAKDEEYIRADELERASTLGSKVDALAIIPGKTLVRVLSQKTREGGRSAAFSKGQTSTWSRDSYLVLKRNGVNSFVIDVPAGEVRVWPVHSLKVVGLDEEKAGPGGAKVDIAVERAKRLESRNISEEETAAALAAPAAPKRVSKPTPKIVALAAAADVRPKRVSKLPKKLSD